MRIKLWIKGLTLSVLSIGTCAFIAACYGVMVDDDTYPDDDSADDDDSAAAADDDSAGD